MDFIFIADFLKWQMTNKEYYKIDGPEGLLELNAIFYVQQWCKYYYNILF